MLPLEKLVRKNIWSLEAYSSARDEFSGKEGVFLDANENPFGELNRYPDPQQKALKQRLSKIKETPEDQIFIGNGSDELIDLVFRIFCEPSRDQALTFTPSYGMYDVSAAINDVKVIKIPLTGRFQIDFDALDQALNDQVKLIFICSPNNPTGNNIEQIDKVIDMFDGVVIVDEAYIDFSDAESMIKKIGEYPNLIVSQTFSKAWGLAGARVGVAYAGREIISLLNKVKPPYNVSELNQKAVLSALENQGLFENRKSMILQQRDWLASQLMTLSKVKKIYPSDANFLLVEVDDANRIYNELVKQKVITRNRNSAVNNCIRITIGSKEENQLLIKTLQNI